MARPDHIACLARLDPATRAVLAERHDGPGLWHLAAHGGLIFGCGTLIASGAPGWWRLLPVQGVLVAFLFTLAHECPHNADIRIMPRRSSRVAKAVCV